MAPARFVHTRRHAASLDRYPDIKLDLSVTDRRIDLIREGFDIAVRIGELEDTNLIGRSLGVLHYVRL